MKLGIPDTVKLDHLEKRNISCPTGSRNTIPRLSSSQPYRYAACTIATLYSWKSGVKQTNQMTDWPTGPPDVPRGPASQYKTCNQHAASVFECLASRNIKHSRGSFLHSRAALLKRHRGVHIPPLFLTLSQLNPVHTVKTVFTTCLNIILSYT
jgi:hypothetical protein